MRLDSLPLWNHAASIENGTAGAINIAPASKYDERQELDLPEDRYRERGYQPPFNELPWLDEAADDA
jgi:hypothetical protein